MHAPFALLLLMLSASLPSSSAGAGDDWPTPDPADAQFTRLGRYQISYATTLEPIEINRIHPWVAQVMDAEGKPVAGARISITGGMPAHDHGLPTAPRATAHLGGGRYLIEGMKFHMGGAWVVELRVKADHGEDSLSIALDL